MCVIVSIWNVIDSNDKYDRKYVVDITTMLNMKCVTNSILNNSNRRESLRLNIV